MDPITLIWVVCISMGLGACWGCVASGSDLWGIKRPSQLEEREKQKLLESKAGEPEIQKKLRQLRNDAIRERQAKIEEFKAKIATGLIDKIVAGCYESAEKVADFYVVNLPKTLGPQVWNDEGLRLMMIDALVECIRQRGLKFYCEPEPAQTRDTVLMISVKY